MNKRQTKKEIKKKYNLSVPRGVKPKKFKQFINKMMEISSKAISDYIDGKIEWGKYGI